MDSDQMLQEITAYSRHIQGDYDYTLEIEPMPTPRPRSKVMSSRKGQPCTPYVLVYHDKSYTDYKEKMKNLMLKVKPGSYSAIHVTFYFPYPASTPKKYLIEGSKHRKRPDGDNIYKVVGDSLEQAGVIVGDGTLSDVAILKRYTTKPKGFISFNLLP